MGKWLQLTDSSRLWVRFGRAFAVYVYDSYACLFFPVHGCKCLCVCVCVIVCFLWVRLCVFAYVSVFICVPDFCACVFGFVVHAVGLDLCNSLCLIVLTIAVLVSPVGVFLVSQM